MWRVTRSFSNIFMGELPQETRALRSLVYYRCERAGMLEVEVLLKRWATANLSKLSHEELVQFHDEVLTLETPELYKLLIGQQQVPEVHFLKELTRQTNRT
mmetsp:Transcript_7097/g.12987  ORF Transcript_7097/g.12987 Transcript_7097/m.12987 type:complete len:101 (-) Transcript_7097:134-436(-)